MSNTKYYYNDRKQQPQGPYSPSDLVELADRGKIKPTTLLYDLDGLSIDASGVIDFNSLSSDGAKVKKEKMSPAFLGNIIRFVVFSIFIASGIYWYYQSYVIASGATEYVHLQIARDSSLLSLISFGFGAVIWFIARPEGSRL